MPIPDRKDAFRATLVEAFEKLMATLAEVPAAAARDVRGEWKSPAFWTAYQSGWGRCILRWHADGCAGRTPIMPAEGFRWNELGALAQSFADERMKMTWSALRSEFESVEQEILDLLDGLSPAEIYEVGRVGWAGAKWPVAKWIQVNTVAPWKAARQKVRKWLAADPAHEAPKKSPAKKRVCRPKN